ncbi:hypothetical protein HMPREF1316_1463 [Olsenella profusa F0195]|uniref:Uncharacterized protein n=1 Tax=Olsenella profusa F0195 TaxID=1125712 RepID=U2TV81_9ACTN|nr:hypothetical protein HMPREF1316_1463 [Olsenella profusa F0195]
MGEVLVHTDPLVGSPDCSGCVGRSCDCAIHIRPRARRTAACRGPLRP